MSDRIKIILAAVCFAGALVLPLLGLGVGWYRWDARAGLVIMLATFLCLFALGGLVLFRLEKSSWLNVSLPYLAGLIYAVSPDLIPLAADDATIAAAGSVVSYALALRKDERTPRWIIVPLLLAAGYMFFGGPIPGGLDELLVNLLAVVITGLGVHKATKKVEEPQEP